MAGCSVVAYRSGMKALRQTWASHGLLPMAPGSSNNKDMEQIQTTSREVAAIPRLRQPIVFLHGLFGYSRIRLRGWTFACYFANIPTLLEKGGNRVHVSQAHPIGSVAERAGQVKSFLDKVSPKEPVHLFAHSMGGLDARYMISRLGMADRVLSLTSIGTPHRGTAFADWGVKRFERLAGPALDLFGLSFQAFKDLTITSCRRFNDEILDSPRVRYFSVAGQHLLGWHSPEWQLPHRIVSLEEGPNDGIVSVTSANYGEECQVWEGDHLSLINWLNPFSALRGLCEERTPYYSRLVQRLVDLGF
jgi:triacylglycerol lipase